MNEEKAKRIIDEYDRNELHDEDERISFIHALEYLIETTNDANYMMRLGDYYYGHYQFEKALSYYKQASLLHHPAANISLGYIYYYGRCTHINYQKAYAYFSSSMEEGNLIASMQIADMYHYGQYVEKNEEIYKGMIKALFVKVKDSKDINDPLPEIFIRLARIYKEEGNIKGALRLYYYAIDFLSYRLCYDGFFGNLAIMKELITDLYSLIDFNEEDFKLFDLYYLLQSPCIVHFVFLDELYEIEVQKKNDQLRIEFNDQCFDSIDEFFEKAVINHQRLVMVNRYLDQFEIL